MQDDKASPPSRMAEEMAREFAIRGVSYEDWLAVMSWIAARYRKTPARLGMDAVLPFGKYAGETVERACRADPGWMRWFLAQPTSYWFAPEVVALVDSLVSDLT